jgi:ferric-dicitrate binding protein FerR (iron transport regulator)
MNDEDIRKVLRPLRDAPRVPTDRREAAFERIRSEWKAGLSEQQSITTEKPGRRWGLATAASVLLVLFSGVLFWVSRDAEGSRTQVATISAVYGDGSFSHDEPIYDQQTINTGAATLSLRLASGLVVRAAPNSELIFNDESHLRLNKGRIFVDSNPATRNNTLLVKTALGDIQHLGTQYLVDYDQERLNVAVREGVIALQKSEEHRSRATATAGEQLSVNVANPQVIERTSVSAADERWSWIETVPSPIDIDGVSLGAFLAWYERETGHRVILQNADPDIRLNGSVSGLTPDDALAAIAIAVELDVTHLDSEVLVSKP